MKKRLMALFMAIIMVFALAACGGGKPSLEKLLKTDEWQEELEGWNDTVAGTGITIDTVADENTLVFEYHLPDSEMFADFTAEDCVGIADVFLGTLEDADFLKVFKAGYKIKLDAVRVVFFDGKGAELYSDELK